MDRNHRKSRRISELPSVLMSIWRLFYWIAGTCVNRFSLGHLALTHTYIELGPNQRAIEYGWVLSNLWKINGRKILDVGAGVGPFALVARRSGYDVTPIDRERLPNILRVDCTHLPWANDSFDGATLISVIEHVSQPEIKRILEEAWRVLKPTGLLFLTTDFSAQTERATQGVRGFTMKTLMNLLQDFIFVETAYFKSIGREHPIPARPVRDPNDADGIMILAKPKKFRRHI